MATRCFVDVDGVVADLCRALARVHNFELETWPRGEYDLTKVFRKPLKAVWGHPEVLGAQFWYGLDRMPWADSLIETLNQYFEGDICFLSQPVRDAQSLAGKAQWLRRWYPKVPFLLGPAKTHLANKGFWLVDDSDKNIDEWNKQGGTGILFPALWNTMHEHHADPLAYVRRLLGDMSGGHKL